LWLGPFWDHLTHPAPEGEINVGMKGVGWVWEGQGLDPGVDPSIFGVGEGCAYFGLSRACYMFHPNTELAMRKLAHVDEVICDIAKWKFRRTPDGGAAHWVDAAPEPVKREAELVSRLSCRFPNISGAIHDDMRGLIQRESCTPEQYAGIHQALLSANPKLRLWAVVYSHELDAAVWAGFESFMDVINLWVWEARNLPHLDEYVSRCRELFPGKPLVMGCYLRDYPTAAPVPMDLLRFQWQTLLRHLEAGTVDAYAILAAVLIDGHPEQAEWVRGFIAANG
jgi:hypothetical protein